MDNLEARQILRRHLETYRSRSYAQLTELIGEPHACELSAPSGKSYQVEVEALWDNQPDGNVRVMGSIDDGGWRAFVPLTQSFIMACDGSLVGE